MTKANPFLFERDFRDPHGAANPKHLADLRAAEDEGFERGLAEGRARAEREIQARLAGAVEAVAGAVGDLLSRMDAHRAEVEADAAALALALARKLAGAALEAQPLTAIAEVAIGAFQHLRGVPHIVVRTHQPLVDHVDRLMHGLARERGFEGRIVVLGEPDMNPHDVRIEWADGGVVRDQARIEAAAAEVLASAGAGRASTRTMETSAS